MASDITVEQPPANKQKEIIRKIRSEHGYPVVELPKTLADKIGLQLNSEITIEAVEVNPLNWEIRIKIKR